MRLQDLLPEIQRVCAYSPDLNKITGSINATLFLCQLIYWYGKQTDANGWIYKTRDEISEELGMSRREQETARKYLKQKNIIQEKIKGVPPRVHIKINFDVLLQLWSQFAQNESDTGTKRNNLTTEPKIITEEHKSDQLISKNETSQLDGNVPDINTEITTKITNNKDVMKNNNKKDIIILHTSGEEKTEDENKNLVSKKAKGVVSLLYNKIKHLGIERSPTWFKKEMKIAQGLLEKYSADEISNVVEWAFNDPFYCKIFNSLALTENVMQRMKGEAYGGTSFVGGNIKLIHARNKCPDKYNNEYYDEPQYAELIRKSQSRIYAS